MTRLTSDVSHNELRGEEVPDFAPASVISTEILFCFNSYQTRRLVMGSYQTWCLGVIFLNYQYHFNIISCLKLIENAWEGGCQENPHFCLEEALVGECCRM
ncbi:hypothetical protein AVEN_29527-1 [Araneus ventricosus]|uniref:Uncharacterized protein n=1 Tax=Araneus ventricosus TaxID=182803 RepID=A0A4Y1ZN51_ARAVE|nr:hypothetical protein AVEN_29527-1 [Araneus ventricosus]